MSEKCWLNYDTSDPLGDLLEASKEAREAIREKPAREKSISQTDVIVSDSTEWTPEECSNEGYITISSTTIEINPYWYVSRYPKPQCTLDEIEDRNFFYELMKRKKETPQKLFCSKPILFRKQFMQLRTFKNLRF